MGLSRDVDYEDQSSFSVPAEPKFKLKKGNAAWNAINVVLDNPSADTEKAIPCCGGSEVWAKLQRMLERECPTSLV